MGVDNEEAKLRVYRPGQALTASAVVEEIEMEGVEEELVEQAAPELDSIQAAAFTAKQRAKLAKEGDALPDGSFPIRNSSDLSNAVQAIGRAKDEAKAKAHIIARAKSLDLTSSLPDGWLTAAGPPKEPLYGDGEKETCAECGGENPGNAEVCRHCAAPLDEQRELTAAAAGMVPVNPPAEWFDDPKLQGPTPLTITADGQVTGHLALFDTCHIANPRGAGVCVQPPRSKTGYSFFHLGQVLAADGRAIPVGQITMDAPHVGAGVDARQVARHYDHTGSAGADVRVGEDQHGIWVAGALRPTVTASAARTLMGAKLSGDWRGMKVGGRSNLELVGILAVNVPGFPVPRPQVLVADGLDMEEEPRLALVAAGIVPDPSPVELRSRSRALAARVSGGLQGLLLAAGFDESKHPRNAPKGKDGKRSPDDGGKFTSKGGSGGGNVKDSLSAVDMGDKGKWEVQGDKLMHMPAGSDTWEMAANTDEFLEGAKPGDVKVQKNGSIMVYDDEVGAWEEAGHVDDFFEETKPSKAKAAKPLVDMSDAELREHRGALKDTQELKSIDSVIDIRTQEILKDAGVPKGKGIIDLSDAQLAALDKKLGPDADPQLKKLVQNTIKGRKGNP